MSDVGTGLARTPIHRALSRPNLFLGADRELVLVTGLMTTILVFVVLTLASTALGLALWLGIVAILRMMAKLDPLMRRVYGRHVRYRQVYRPTSSPWRRC